MSESCPLNYPQSSNIFISIKNKRFTWFFFRKFDFLNNCYHFNFLILPWLWNLKDSAFSRKCFRFFPVFFRPFSGMIPEKGWKNNGNRPEKSGNFSGKERNLLSFQVCRSYISMLYIDALVWYSMKLWKCFAFEKAISITGFRRRPDLALQRLQRFLKRLAPAPRNFNKQLRLRN